MAEVALNLFAPHEEAAAIIRNKPAMARAVFDGLLPELRARAITVTGLHRLDAVERIRESIASLAEGKTWDDAKAEVTAELTALEDGAERRAELLLRTHAFQAFQTSTWRSAQADRDTTHLQYLATEDARVRDSHLALNGLIFPKQDTFWHDHTPPWEWGCRCRIRALSVDDVADERARDTQRNPEDRLVMDGPRAEKARQGDLVRGPQTLPDGSKTSGGQIDVTAPAKKRTEKTPYQYHPDNLRLSVNDLKARYAPEDWQQFESWANKTEVAPSQTVMEWLKGAELPLASVVPPPPPTPALTPPAPVRQAPVSRHVDTSKLSGPVKEAVEHAIQAIDQAHDDGQLNSMPIKAVKSRDFSGRFKRKPGVGGLGIDISTWGDHPELTTAHEIGHWLDNDAIGKKGTQESNNANGLMKDVLTACKQSRAVLALKTNVTIRRARLDYYLSHAELWARAYAQFIATRTVDAKMLAQLQSQRSKLTGLQWEKDDFDPVQRAIEALFTALGWL